MTRTTVQALRHCPVCGGPPPTGLRDYQSWAFDMLPENVGFTDIDAILERRGNILILEFKETGQGTYLPRGQWLLFQTLVLRPYTNVWVLAPTPDGMYEVRFIGVNEGVRLTVSKGQLRKMVQAWWDEAGG